MRLTADLVERAPQFTNAVREFEMDLRGNKIPEIENIGATKDNFDTIDLSDNDISVLDNFPIMRRLRTLLLSNNRVSRIAPGVGKFLPSLNALILSNNYIRELADVLPLQSFASLRVLSLLRNPVTKQKNYRLFVIHALPQVRILDFRRIRAKEREEASKVFGAESAESAAAAARACSSGVEEAQVFVVGEVAEGSASVASRSVSTSLPPQRLSREMMDRILKVIAESHSLEAITRLEKCLEDGVVPPEEWLKADGESTDQPMGV